MRPEDRYTVVRYAIGERGYVINCKVCGHLGLRATLIEAKRVRDEHEPLHHPDPLRQEVGR
jgi:hypothetical protein